MAFEYFLYDTNFNNTLIDRGVSSFAPLPPNTGEIFIDFNIPEIQPLYLYKELTGNIVANDDQTIDDYINNIYPPVSEDSVEQEEFTGYTATTKIELDKLNSESALYSFSKTQSNGTQTEGFGLTVNRIGAGVYEYIFDQSVASLNYGVFAQPFGTLTDTNSQISNITLTGFTVSMGVGDNSATDDVLTDTEHSVGVFGVPISGTSGITVVSQNTFTGYTAQTAIELADKINIVTGATGNVGEFDASGNLIDSGYNISQLTGGSISYLPITGGTITGDLIISGTSSVSEKYNLKTGFNNDNITDGDLWADDSLYFRSGNTTYNLIPPISSLKSVQVRQSLQVNNIPQSWTDFNWNTTDIENDNTVIEHNTTNTDRIYVFQDGLYFISYQYQIDDESSTRVRINDTTIINGSETIADATATSLPVSKSFLVNLVAGDFITMQTFGLAFGQDIDEGATMIIVKFEGLKGDKGDSISGGSNTIILEEENVQVNNTPHNTLNFDNNFTVTDEGSGKATVSLGTGMGSKGLCELIDTTGGQEVTNITPVVMLWDTTEFIDTNYFAISGTNITVLVTGLYEISYNINAANQTNNRVTNGVQIRKNGTLIGKTLSANYSRNSSNNDNQNSIPSTTVSMTANDNFDLVLFRLGDNNSSLTKPNASFLRIKYLGS